MKILSALLLLVSTSAFAAESGKPAPAFTATNSEGKEVKLSDYKGKFVVLEWMNHECPFVKKQYETNNMQTLQETYTGKGVVWLSVISSAEGNEGYVTPAQAEADRKTYASKATSVILDKSGKLGKLYGAQTTPHMFVVDKKGVLIYQGAIDDKPLADKEALKTVKNYVADALEANMAGRSVATAQTKSYGCSVKY